jgi:hypothetical protein
MMNQTSPQVNPITVKELRMSFLHFMPAMALLQSRKPPDIPFPFLVNDVDFQEEYAKALAGGTALRTPWRDGYGKLFWFRYLPTRNPYEMWRALVPLDYDLAPQVTSLVLGDGSVAVGAYLYPWGIGMIVDVTLQGPLLLNDAVNRALEIRSKAKIQWKFDTKSGSSSPTGLAAAIRERLGTAVYGDKVAPAELSELFSVVTVTDAAGVVSTDPIAENGPIHCALEGLAGWNPHWATITPTSLPAGKISARQAPAGHILYGKRRGRAVWFPGDFRNVAAYADTLSCYHQNLSMCSLQTESLCQLAQDAATELRNKGSLDAFSTTYRDCAQLAAGILGRLHGKKTDESASQKPKIYRSGSVRTQIQMYKDDVNLLRHAIPTINSELDA